MKDEDEEAEDEQAEIGDWTLYVSRYYAVCAPGVNRHPSCLPSYLLPSPPHISLDAECHIQDPCSSAKCQHVYAYVLILLVDEILALEE